MSTDFARRVDLRCRIELDLPWIDAVWLHPEATDRIVADEWAIEEAAR